MRKKLLGYIVMFGFLSITLSPTPVHATTVSSLVDFNAVTDLTTLLNDDGTPAFSNQAASGINNTGSVNVPIGSDEIWTTKQGYSVTGNSGDKYTFSAYFKVAQNSGWGNLGFTASDNNATASKGQPALGLGANFHGGGGGFFNDGTETTLSWPPDLVLGNWYWMTFEVEAQGSNVYDLKLQIWNTDATGVIGVMKTEKTQLGVTNTTLGGASTIHAFFGASGSRMDTIDDFKVELVGATFVEEDEPVVIAEVLGAPDDDSITYGGTVTDDQGYAVTARGSCWSTSPNPTTADDCTTDGSGVGSFTSNIENLTPGTIYYIRTYATNSQGTTYGPEESFTTTGSVPVDDNDGVSKSTEDAAPNAGDANNDGTADSEQARVTSLVSSVSNDYIVLETDSSCTTNTAVLNEQETTITTKDDDYFDYPAGLLDFSLSGCGVGGATTITQYYFGDFSDLSDLQLRKYDKTTDTYTTIEDASLSLVTIGGKTAIKAVYTVTDGGELDADGVANGVIVDPVGLGQAVEVLAETGTSDIYSSLLVGISLAVTSLILVTLSRKNTTSTD